mmetsp:Transcript_52818/g.103278  ORF Transcript_52818/g.103278 Transcript_52818/m.103278 type:complete len:138 (+) Transcript_52818:166-579(+)
MYGGMQQPMLQQPGVMQPSVMQPSIVQHPSVMTGMTGVTSGPYKPEYAAAFPQLSAPNEQTVSLLQEMYAESQVTNQGLKEQIRQQDLEIMELQQEFNRRQEYYNSQVNMLNTKNANEITAYRREIEARKQCCGCAL